MHAVDSINKETATTMVSVEVKSGRGAILSVRLSKKLITKLFLFVTTVMSVFAV